MKLKERKKKALKGKAAQLKALAEATPFRPFTVRLLNGKSYTFHERSDFGAPRDFHAIVDLSSTTAATVYMDEITDILEEVNMSEKTKNDILFWLTLSLIPVGIALMILGALWK